MIVIGIDPHSAKPYAISVFEDGVFLESFETSDTIDLYDVMNTNFMHSDVTVVIEDQYMNRNYDTAKKLSISAGVARGIALLVGCKADIMNVATWQSVVGIKFEKGLTKRSKEKIIEQKALEFGYLIENVDQASSALIARAYMQVNGLYS